MTCIVGYRNDDGVWIGGDSLGSNDWGQQIATAQPKVFTNGPMLIGCCGSFRLAQLLQYVVDFERCAHPAGMPDHEYLVRYFIEEVRQVLHDGGLTHVKNNVEEISGIAIIAYRNNLYTIDEDFQVFDSTRPYMATGSGMDIALGAMSVLVQYDITPEEMITEALRAAEEHNAFVKGPFVVVKHV